MPNWCSNHLIIENMSDDAQKEELMGLYLDGNPFHAIVPQPQEILDSLSDMKPGMPAWYHWRLENWGCKWDVDAGDIQFDWPNCDYEESCVPGDVLHVYFDTPWGPPDHWFKAFCAKYSNCAIRLKWEEPGMDESGTLYSENLIANAF